MKSKRKLVLIILHVILLCLVVIVFALNRVPSSTQPDTLICSSGSVIEVGCDFSDTSDVGRTEPRHPVELFSVIYGAALLTLDVFLSVASTFRIKSKKIIAIVIFAPFVLTGLSTFVVVQQNDQCQHDTQSVSYCMPVADESRDYPFVAFFTKLIGLDSNGSTQTHKNLAFGVNYLCYLLLTSVVLNLFGKYYLNQGYNNSDHSGRKNRYV